MSDNPEIRNQFDDIDDDSLKKKVAKAENLALEDNRARKLRGDADVAEAISDFKKWFFSTFLRWVLVVALVFIVATVLVFM